MHIILWKSFELLYNITLTEKWGPLSHVYGSTLEFLPRSIPLDSHSAFN
jgi:hypothetical protein